MPFGVREGPFPGELLDDQAERDEEGQRHHGRDGHAHVRQRPPQSGAANLKPTPRTVCRYLGFAALSPNLRRNQYK